MNPLLYNAIPNIIARLRATGQTQAADELERYRASNGQQPLSPSTLAVAEPYARQSGTTFMQPGGAGGAPTEPMQRVPGEPQQYAGDQPPQHVTPPPAPNGPSGMGVTGGALAAGRAAIPGGTPSPLPGGLNPMEGMPGMPGQQANPVPIAQTTRNIAPRTMTEIPPPSGGGGVQVPTGNGSGGPFSAQQGQFLLNDDDVLKRFAMLQAGFNPDIITRGSRVAEKTMIPIISAYRNAYGAGQGLNGDVEGLPAFLQAAAKQFTTPGAGFYGNARKFAQDLLGGSGIDSFLGNVSSQDEQFAFLQSLAPLLVGGSNPMIQQSVSDQLGNLFDKYGYDEFESGKQRTLRDYLGTNRDKLSPAIRSLFGPLLR